MLWAKNINFAVFKYQTNDMKMMPINYNLKYDQEKASQFKETFLVYYDLKARTFRYILSTLRK